MMGLHLTTSLVTLLQISAFFLLRKSSPGLLLISHNRLAHAVLTDGYVQATCTASEVKTGKRM